MHLSRPGSGGESTIGWKKTTGGIIKRHKHVCRIACDRAVQVVGADLLRPQHGVAELGCGEGGQKGRVPWVADRVLAPVKVNGDSVSVDRGRERNLEGPAH